MVIGGLGSVPMILAFSPAVAHCMNEQEVRMLICHLFDPQHDVTNYRIGLHRRIGPDSDYIDP